MNTKKTVLAAAIALGLGGVHMTSHAALPTGTLLQFDAGVRTCNIASKVYPSCGTAGSTVTSGTYFSMDVDGNGTVADSEKTTFAPGPDGGLIFGVTQDTNGHVSHSGPPHSGVGGIDNEWLFFSNAGMAYTKTTPITVAVDNGSTKTLDFSGWTVTWNGIATIPMGGDTANFPTDPGTAILTCSPTSCVNGSTFTLSYFSHVPLNDVSGFGGVRYVIFMAGHVRNGLPTAGNKSFTVAADSSNNAWSPNASDPNPLAAGGTPNTSLTCSIVTPPSHGSAVITNCTSATYTPTASYTGADSFTYKVNDGLDDSAANGTVSVTVSAAVVLPPVANDDTATTVTETPVAIDVVGGITTGAVADTGNSIDVTTVVATDPPHGAVVDNNDGTVTYTPDAGFSGTDTFSYTVDNSGGTSNSADVTVTVNANIPVSSTGTTLSGGSYADSNGLVISALPADPVMATSCIGGCFDFSISGVSGSVNVVLPLDAALPAGFDTKGAYRKYNPNTSAWHTFDGTTDTVKSAVGTGTNGTPATCPPPGSSDGTGVNGYRGGMNVGDRCLELTLTDNGPNDTDATVGVVADPGGAGVYAGVSPAPTGTSGCSLSATPVDPRAHADWWLLAGFLAWLGAVIHRRRA